MMARGTLKERVEAVDHLNHERQSQDMATSQLITDLWSLAKELVEVVEIIRDADDDCKRDGLPRLVPSSVRCSIDAVIAKAQGEM